MPKCPKCNHDIDFLVMQDTTTTHVSLGSSGELVYERKHSGFGDQVQYRCPHCNQPLFYDSGSATEFLKGGG